MGIIYTADGVALSGDFADVAALAAVYGFVGDEYRQKLGYYGVL